MSIKITEAARARIMEALTFMGGKYFRVEVMGGGCSGYQYDFRIAVEADADDTLVPIDAGYFVVIDPASMKLMEDSEIDYVKELGGDTMVVRNPNASKCCGCGKSFSA